MTRAVYRAQKWIRDHDGEELARGVGRYFPGLSPAVLAAIALADDWPGSEQALTNAFEKRWRTELLPALRDPSPVPHFPTVSTCSYSRASSKSSDSSRR